MASDLGAEAPGYPDLAEQLSSSRSTLFIEVGDLDSVIPIIEAQGAPVIVPRRQTFYGMDEIFVEAPCGTLVGFAAPLEKRDWNAIQQRAAATSKPLRNFSFSGRVVISDFDISHILI